MSETVVFLGAGASKLLGLPLTKEIFPGVLSGLDQTLFADDAEDRKALADGLRAVPPGLDCVRPGREDAERGLCAFIAQGLPFHLALMPPIGRGPA